MRGRRTSADPKTPEDEGAGALDAWLSSRRALVEATLPELLPARHGQAGRVHDAMAWALLGPGKRIRPLVAIAVGEMYRVEATRAVKAACAIELVHTASLILDDLPCMDDAPERRGRPACHVAWGEAAAVLAAVALLNEGFALLADDGCVPTRLRSTLTRRLAGAIGLEGVIGGQAADLALGDTLPGAGADLSSLEFIHSRKTGALFIVAAELGARIGGATSGERAVLGAFAKDLGLAFQITDDLIDATGRKESAGKPVRRDEARVSFVTLCGVEGARTLAAELVETAVAALEPFGRRAERLRVLARRIAVRDR